MSSRLVLVLPLLLAGCTCGSTSTPPDDDLDGNVVVGMGDPDGGPRDAGPPRDAGDAGDERDGGDAPPGDGGIPDAGMEDAGDRCAEPSEMTMTSEEAISQIARWDGMLVTVVGTATRTPYVCTDVPCPPEMPCCNTCEASLLIDGVIELDADPCFGAEAECAGTECAQVCTPALLGVEERFMGRLRDATNGDPIRLELYEVTP
jgi:hypothetical protein